MKVNRRERIDIRLLELETPFFDYADDHGIKPSTLIRYFIKNGLKENGGLPFEQYVALRKDMFELSKSMSRIGGNLNQISRNYSIHNFLDESDLHKELKQSQADFKNAIDILKEVRDII